MAIIDFTTTQVYNPQAGRARLGIDLEALKAGIAAANATAENTAKQAGPTGPRGNPGPAGPPGPSAPASVSLVAHENIPAFSPVLSTGYIADSTDPSGSFGRLLGIAPAAMTSGFYGNVTIFGAITNPAWTWTPGDIVYLNGSALSTTAPSSGFSQRVGTAKNSTTIFIELGEPIIL